LKHFRSGSLLLEGFRQVSGPLAQLVEQSRILDGNDSLVGECSNEIDLFAAER
jgi:hypothetical protein